MEKDKIKIKILTEICEEILDSITIVKVCVQKSNKDKANYSYIILKEIDKIESSVNKIYNTCSNDNEL